MEYTHEFVWMCQKGAYPSAVYVTGSFDNWSKWVHLRNGTRLKYSHKITFPIQQAVIFYKYIVDGVWMLQRGEPTCIDQMGFENHFFPIPAPLLKAPIPPYFQMTFDWPSHTSSSTVFLVGSFNEWTKWIQLPFNSEKGCFEITLTLPRKEDKIVFKFIENGAWCTRPDYKVVARNSFVNHEIRLPDDMEFNLPDLSYLFEDLLVQEEESTILPVSTSEDPEKDETDLALNRDTSNIDLIASPSNSSLENQEITTGVAADIPIIQGQLSQLHLEKDHVDSEKEIESFDTVLVQEDVIEPLQLEQETKIDIAIDPVPASSDSPTNSAQVSCDVTQATSTTPETVDQPENIPAQPQEVSSFLGQQENQAKSLASNDDSCLPAPIPFNPPSIVEGITSDSCSQ